MFIASNHKFFRRSDRSDMSHGTPDGVLYLRADKL
jgi:hypothetical protein